MQCSFHSVHKWIKCLSPDFGEKTCEIQGRVHLGYLDHLDMILNWTVSSVLLQESEWPPHRPLQQKRSSPWWPPKLKVTSKLAFTSQALTALPKEEQNAQLAVFTHLCKCGLKDSGLWTIWIDKDAHHWSLTSAKALTSFQKPAVKLLEFLELSFSIHWSKMNSGGWELVWTWVCCGRMGLWVALLLQLL